MARQFDFQKLTVIRALRTVSTSPGSAAGTPVPGPGKPASVPGAGTKSSTAGLLKRLQSDGRVVSLLHSYEDVVGIGDVKRAQNRVTQIEEHFLEVRETVKKSAQELHNIQAELRSIRSKLDRTPRDDVKFLEYATEEHLTIQKEKKLVDNHTTLEDVERSTFSKLSAAVRESHEKQRAQEERTKYWGVIGSILGTIIGLLGSTVINQKRMRELRTMVGDLQTDIGQEGQLRDLQGLVSDIRTAIGGSAESSAGPDDLTGTLETLVQKQQDGLDAQEKNITNTLKQQEAVLLKEMEGVRRSNAVGAGDVTAALEKLAQQQRDGLDVQEKSLTNTLKQQEAVLLKEMEGVRRFAAIGTGDMTTLEELVHGAEQKLEWEMKMSTLSTVVFIYGAFALTLPILYSIFK